MGNETVTDVVRDFIAMAEECGGLEAATIHAMTARLSVAHAREVEANDAYIREANRRISVLASLLNQANVDRLREVEALQLALDNEQAKGVHSCSVHCERPLCVMTRRAEAAEADARRWRHVRDEMTYHYGDGQTEPRECGIHLEWFQGPWVRDGSNGGSGRPDSFPGWDTIVDEAITKLADELQELDDDAAIASGGEG